MKEVTCKFCKKDLDEDKGEWIHFFEELDSMEWVRASYNPYKLETFVIGNDEPIFNAKYAKLTEQGLFVSL